VAGSGIGFAARVLSKNSLKALLSFGFLGIIVFGGISFLFSTCLVKTFLIDLNTLGLPVA